MEGRECHVVLLHRDSLWGDYGDLCSAACIANILLIPQHWTIGIQIHDLKQTGKMSFYAFSSLGHAALYRSAWS